MSRICVASIALGLACATMAPRAEAAPSSACAQIRQACVRAGFPKGPVLNRECFKPIIGGAASGGPGAPPLPAIDPSVVASCAGRNQQTPTAASRSPTPNPVPVSGLVVNVTPQPVDLTFDGLVHAPNGHISVLRRTGGLEVWVAGKPANDTQGSYYYHLTSWGPAQVSRTQPTRLRALVAPRDQGTEFNRDYEALNAVVLAPHSSTLIGVLDAEFHPTQANPNAFLSSIGLTTSTDGVTWSAPVQIVRGIDALSNPNTLGIVASHTDTPHADGASGPSAIVRDVGGGRNQPFIYVYFADRDPITAGQSRSAIYVARAPISGRGVSGVWQKWNGGSWTAVSDPHPAPVLSLTQAGELTQPMVSWNSALRGYLMFFSAKNGFYASMSSDGLSWTTPILALRAARNKGDHSAYPSYFDPKGGSQQSTTASGDFIYGEYGKNVGGYKGVQQTMTVSLSRTRPTPTPRPPPTPRPAPCAHGVHCHQ